MTISKKVDVAVENLGQVMTVDAAKGRLEVSLSEKELKERLAHWTPPPPRYSSGALAKYGRLVSYGATVDICR